MSVPPPPPPPGSPPPPPPPPPPPGGSVAPFSVGDAVSYGWNAYWPNVGPMVLIALIIFAASLVLNIVGGSIDSVAGQLILQALVIIVGAILAMGLIRAAIAITEGRKPEPRMLLVTDGLWSYVGAAIVFYIAVFVGLILLIVPGIIILVMWHLFGYSIVQDPGTSPIEALRRSAEITKGHRWPLFGLLIVLFLINIVGVLACLVGLIFTYGITAVSVAYAYKTLSGQPVARP